MAVKIVRQANKIVLIGAPTSAAAHAPGHERAPGALREAGLVERLREIGYEVEDHGDGPAQLYQPDEEHPRARNVPPLVEALNALKPLVEQAVKSGALPLILGGDCSIALATVAGARRYYRGVSLLYFDSDADLNVPATSPSGCLDGMVVAHLTGRGAPELVRFWGEPPLVREPDIVLFGVNRFDKPEQQLLENSPIGRHTADEIRRRGASTVAEAAMERIHGNTSPFVLHFDVDAISADDFRATNFPGTSGLRLEEVRQALEVFARQKELTAFEVTVYNPDRDPDGSAAKLLVDLLASVLATRLAVLTAPEPVAAELEAEAEVASEATAAASSTAAPTESAEVETAAESEPAAPPTTESEAGLPATEEIPARPEPPAAEPASETPEVATTESVPADAEVEEAPEQEQTPQ